MDTRGKRFCVKPYCRYELLSGLSVGLEVVVDGCERVHILTYPQPQEIEIENGSMDMSSLANSHAVAVFMALAVLHPEADVSVEYLDGNIEERQPSMLFEDMDI